VVAPEAWDADAAVLACAVVAWHGRAWRAHRRNFEAADHGGSLLVSGRYHRAPDVHPPAETWPALYLALAPEICLGEVLRHIRPERLPLLNDYRISEFDIRLIRVLDCRNPAAMGITADVLWHDLDYTVPQSLAAASLRRGVEAILVPSATRLGDNLIIFPTQVQTQSQIAVIGSREPRLYVERTP
jgi:hypothetical protein